jgi:hypothetical protein
MDRTNIARQLNIALKFLAQNLSLDDSQKMEIADLYPDWTPSKAYAVDTLVKYGVNTDNETQLYKVVQAHTSQADWTPDQASSLFAKIGFTDSGVPLWVQPQGAHDAWQAGERVSYNGKIYVSTIDNNIWEPTVYGWEEE